MDKRLFYTLCIIIFSKGALFGQTTYAGIRLVPQASWIMNKTDASKKGFKSQVKKGIAFGAGIGTNISDKMGVGVDLLYSMEGREYKIDSITYTNSNSYIKLPLLVTYTKGYDDLRFVAKIGPQLGFLTGSQSKSDKKNDVSVDTKEKYAKIVPGIVLSASALYVISDDFMVDAGLRFDRAILNSENESFAGYSGSRKKAFNQTLGFQISLNYIIN